MPGVAAAAAVASFATAARSTASSSLTLNRPLASRPSLTEIMAWLPPGVVTACEPPGVYTGNRSDSAPLGVTTAGSSVPTAEAEGVVGAAPLSAPSSMRTRKRPSCERTSFTWTRADAEASMPAAAAAPTDGVAGGGAGAPEPSPSSSGSAMPGGGTISSDTAERRLGDSHGGWMRTRKRPGDPERLGVVADAPPSSVASERASTPSGLKMRACIAPVASSRTMATYGRSARSPAAGEAEATTTGGGTTTAAAAAAGASARGGGAGVDGGAWAGAGAGASDGGAAADGGGGAAMARGGGVWSGSM